MPQITIPTERNTLISYFPYAERAFSKGEPYEGYVLANDVFPVDVDNTLGQLFVCIKTTALPAQNPAHLLITSQIVRFSGLLFSGTFPTGGFGTVGVIFQPYSNIEGGLVTLALIP